MDDKNLPGTLASILPLVLPLLLIVGNTTCSMLLPEDSIVVAITSFIGDANVALAIGALLAVVFLGKRMGKDTVMKVVDKSLKEAGPSRQPADPSVRSSACPEQVQTWHPW